MNKQVKKKWLKALRSGEYKQGQENLNKDNAFCCLGVLCDLHAEEVNGKWISGKYLGSSSLLPHIVSEWAGLLDNEDEEAIIYKGKCKYLTSANDNGYSFKQIANIIENQL